MKYLVFAVLMGLCLTLQAGNVTTFLGIPVKGTHDEMVEKLKDEGFKLSKDGSSLEGKINSDPVKIYIQTYKDKVYGITVADDKYYSEKEMKRRYNAEIERLKADPEYFYVEGEAIPEEEMMANEIRLNNKTYKAIFLQLSEKEQELLASEDDIPLKKLVRAARNRPVMLMLAENLGRFMMITSYVNYHNTQEAEEDEEAEERLLFYEIFGF